MKKQTNFRLFTDGVEVRISDGSDHFLFVVPSKLVEHAPRMADVLLSINADMVYGGNIQRRTAYDLKMLCYILEHP